MRTIKVTYKQLKKVIQKANTQDDDWQAEAIEILLIPQVYKYWQRINKKLYDRDFEIERVAGKPYKGQTPEMNHETGNAGEWGKFYGYIFKYDWGAWNGVSQYSYMHSASCAWDGLRRESLVSFVHELRLFYFMASKDNDKEAQKSAQFAADRLFSEHNIEVTK